MMDSDVFAGNPPAFGQASAVLWQPSGIIGANLVRTWKQVYSLIKSSEGPVTVITTSDPADAGLYTIPAGLYNMRAGTFLLRTIGNATVIICEDGVTFDNLEWIIGVNLQMNPSSGNSFEKSLSPPGQVRLLLQRLGSVIGNRGSVPLINVDVDNPFICGWFDQANGFDPSSTAPFINLQRNALAAVFAGFCSPQARMPDNFITSDDETSTLLLAHDGSIPMPLKQFSGFGGTIVNNPVGVVGGSGPTELRPNPTQGLWPTQDGCMYRDNTINKTIWWSTTANHWVDANGAGPQ
jgi:hypothetical protein